MQYLENGQAYYLLHSRHRRHLVGYPALWGKDGEEEMSTQRHFIVSLSFVNQFVGFVLLYNSQEFFFLKL